METTINKGFSETRPFAINLSAMEIKTLFYASYYNMKRAADDIYKWQIRQEEVANCNGTFDTMDLSTIKWRYNIARDCMEQMYNALRGTRFFDPRWDTDYKFPYDYFDLPKTR